MEMWSISNVVSVTISTHMCLLPQESYSLLVLSLITTNDTPASSPIILPDAGPSVAALPAGRWSSAFTGTLVVLITLSWI
ncbi:hypothetical protein [Xylella fastidiosa]|nr:hypothetical protein [Xylella fastidiosa]EGO82539.1 hypothetical protein XFEB_00616 [Xylella fastidiosa EB92.1]MBE0263436.1 hypothetical protein [Xylella fastidiosa subsp. fastidiosa]NMR12050.1 hypothetical protein [Xylella fastidiosa]NMR45789.1 hypothetical protein [Xylella fastidiosa]